MVIMSAEWTEFTIRQKVSIYGKEYIQQDLMKSKTVMTTQTMVI